MTALKQYDRLESLGLWRASRAAQRREVVVSFGNATLVVSDTAGRPLSHWSLPAVKRLNPHDSPALFAPDADTSETLEIDDAEMIAAIETVRGSLARVQPRQGRVRQVLTVALLLTVLGAGALWGPDALRQQAAATVTDQGRAEIGATILGHLQARTGPSCRAPRGRAALQRLRTRLYGPGRSEQIIVLPAALPGPLALPGNLIVIDRAVLVRYDDPSVAAGEVLAAGARAGDPLDAVLRGVGLRASLQLLTDGDLPDDALSGYAAALLARDDTPPKEPDLLAAFANAKVPSTPYAALRTARDQNGGTLIQSDPMLNQTVPQILSDTDWIRLQSICDG